MFVLLNRCDFKWCQTGKYTGMILINLQKVFDTLDHKILLEKMKCTAFADKTITCLHSYLISKASLISLDNVFSEAGTINCGVSHGPKKAPLLFLLYIHDIQQTIK